MYQIVVDEEYDNEEYEEDDDDNEEYEEDEEDREIFVPRGGSTTATTTTTATSIPNDPPLPSECLLGYDPSRSVLFVPVRTRMCTVRYAPFVYRLVNGFILPPLLKLIPNPATAATTTTASRAALP